MKATLLSGNCKEVLKTLAPQSVQMCVTSPPYYGLRNYGTDYQIFGGDSSCQHDWQKHIEKPKGGRNLPDNMPNTGGNKTQQATNSPRFGTESDFCSLCNAWRGELGLEPSPELYVEHLVDVFREVRRVLKDNGTLWLNLGDSYNGSQKGSGGTGAMSKKQNSNKGANYAVGGKGLKMNIEGMKPKDLIGIPWMVAFALRSDGWYLRSDIIWHKPNPMPEGVKDRPTKSHEYIFLLSKSQKYYYDADAIKEPATTYKTDKRNSQQLSQRIQKRNSETSPHKNMQSDGQPPNSFHVNRANGGEDILYETRNRRDVWTIGTKPFSGAKLMTDYVGGDGKPYTASPDCPIHGHLALSRRSCTPEYDAQPIEIRPRTSDSDSHLASESVSELKSTTSHTRLEEELYNSLLQTPENMSENKILDHQNEHTLPVQNPVHNSSSSKSRELLDYKTDSLNLEYSVSAKHRSRQKSKIGRARQTEEHGKPSAQTLFGIQSNGQLPLLSVQGENSGASSISTGDSGGHPSADILGGIADISSCGELYCTCKVASIDHFATFPPALIEPCVLSGSAAGDIVLDPFNGAGTTGLVALQNARNYIGIDLNPKYIELTKSRLAEAGFPEIDS